MKFFSKEELIVLVSILGAIALVSFGNFQVSLRRSRDSNRKQDVSRIATAVSKYHEDFGFFPPATKDGRIVACKDIPGPVTLDEDTDKTLEQKLFEVMRPCEWGKDPLRDVTDPGYPPYMESLPNDPQYEKGVQYFYRSNTNKYQIYTSLEGEDEDEYTPAIEKQGYMCGVRVCNYGKSSGSTPLDKTIREYENELRTKDDEK